MIGHIQGAACQGAVWADGFAGQNSGLPIVFGEMSSKKRYACTRIPTCEPLALLIGIRASTRTAHSD